MTNTNLEMATAELHQALVNFKNMAQATENVDLRIQAEEAYNDMATWFNYFVSHEDMHTQELQKVVVIQLA